ncbi:MAG TPA: hypothetical protein VF669_11140 [Tepidisphaeraceae bacterium]|jgi:hypothetical protein
MTQNPDKNTHTAETQQQRWIKYGSNVALSVVVVVLLAAAITWIAQSRGSRVDTTTGRVNSLKPQTINILKDNSAKTKLVALYAEKDANNKPNVNRQPVIDLLEEYHRKGKNVEVEVIDPVNSPSKVDGLITEVTDKYGGEVRKYKDVIDVFTSTYKQIKEASTQQLKEIEQRGLDKVKEDQLPESISLALLTVKELPKFLEQSKESIEKKSRQKPPDYKGAASSIEQNMEVFSQMAEKILQDFDKAKADQKIPENIRKYMADSTPAYTQIKKSADDLLKQVKGLGELKLDDLRQSLRSQDSILVMGEKDMRVIPRDQVWQYDQREARQLPPGQELKPRFAGEQQVSTAILALKQEKKPKVAFIRMGGPPLTTPGFPPFQRGGPMSSVAQRLRDYNFDVLEKDLSGMWAMQSQMSGQPPAPEATDEQLKDAIWIVLMFPLSQQGPMQPPADFKRVSDHLAHGGSALLMFNAQTDNFKDTLANWGIEVNTNAVAAHEPINVSGGRENSDVLSQAAQYPFIFNIENYGDHMLTKPLRSMPGFFVPFELVKTTAAKDVTVTPIIPIPNQPTSWGETDLAALNEGKAVFDKDKDVEGPLFGGAVAERKDGGRVVVIACPTFAFDDWVTRPDPTLYRQGIYASRYPANAELFANSVFWLSKMEPMIAISPAAMEVSRISSMSDGALKAWRIGGLLVGLPALVIVAGGFVYFARRD